MFKKLRITCDEATTICDKSQYKEASIFEKLQLSWHLFMCKICGMYVQQNKTLTRVFKLKASDCKKTCNSLSEADKELLKKELEKLN